MEQYGDYCHTQYVVYYHTHSQNIDKCGGNPHSAQRKTNYHTKCGKNCHKILSVCTKSETETILTSVNLLSHWWKLSSFRPRCINPFCPTWSKSQGFRMNVKLATGAKRRLISHESKSLFLSMARIQFFITFLLKIRLYDTAIKSRLFDRDAIKRILIEKTFHAVLISKLQDDFIEYSLYKTCVLLYQTNNENTKIRKIKKKKTTGISTVQ